ncbi:MAG: cation transporter [Bacteroidetes bacterium]|jgi:copper chaperone CopZ|nr:cation transporter [Bacteroidota bacterium]
MINRLLFICIMLMPLASVAQKSKVEEVKIHTSAECSDCKKRIEHAVLYMKGVKFANQDINSQILTVSYNTSKTSPEKIMHAITEAGYDADSLKANQEAYDKLPDCCKKGGHKE